MNDNLFDKWCRQATKEIRYGPDRQQVYRELMAHLEDSRDARMGAGMAEEEATRKALAAMGEATAIAPELGKIHRPFWGYFYRVVKMLAIGLCAVAIYTVLSRISSTVGYYIDRSNGAYELPFDAMETYSVINHDATAWCDGYRFTVSRSVYWRYEDENHLRFRLEVICPDLFANKCWAVDHIWAVDDRGTYYLCDDDRAGSQEPQLWINTYSGVGMVASYVITVEFMPSDYEAKWLELHYDRDGREMVLRFELKGGVGP